MDAYGFWILATSDCIHSTALLHLATRAPTSRAESHRHHRGQEPKSLEQKRLGLRYHINTWMSLPLSPGQASSHTSIDHGQKGVPLAGSWEESLDKRIHKWDETTIELLLTTRPFARQCLPPNKNVCGRLKLEFDWTVIRKKHQKCMRCIKKRVQVWYMFFLWHQVTLPSGWCPWCNISEASSIKSHSVTLTNSQCHFVRPHWIIHRIIDR